MIRSCGLFNSTGGRGGIRGIGRGDRITRSCLISRIGDDSGTGDGGGADGRVGDDELRFSGSRSP